MIGLGHEPLSLDRGTKGDQWLLRCTKGPAQIRLQCVWGRNDRSRLCWPCWFAVRFFSEMGIENIEQDGKGRSQGRGKEDTGITNEDSRLSGHVQGGCGGGYPDSRESRSLCPQGRVRRGHSDLMSVSGFTGHSLVFRTSSDAHSSVRDSSTHFTGGGN